VTLMRSFGITLSLPVGPVSDAFLPVFGHPGLPCMR
jgi:hypothetical protein